MTTKLKKSKNTTVILVLLSVMFGVLCGIYFPEWTLSIQWVGQIFFNLLKALVLPLIFTAIVTAITSMGGLEKLGSVGFYTLCYIFLGVFVAASIGMLLFNLFSPGAGLDPTLLGEKSAETLQKVDASRSFVAFLQEVFPSNVFASAVKFQIMPIVFFAIFFGIACASLGEGVKNINHIFHDLKSVLVRMIGWVITISPIGVFSLIGAGVATSVSQHNLLKNIYGLAMFIVVFLSGLCLQILWQLLVIKFVAKRNLIDFLKIIFEALTTAFGTSSSIATLPVSMEAVQKLRVHEDVSRFVMPFASSISLGGTVMYEATAALFFSQIMGLHLSFSDQALIFMTSIVAGMGATGIPEGGIITMITVLRAVNIPVSAISILLPLDRILDRFRTVVNVWGDICAAVVVDELVKRKVKKTKKSPL